LRAYALVEIGDSEANRGFAGSLRFAGGREGRKGSGYFLKAVPPGPVALIANLQPYAGCMWTRDLRELSNQDKHRQLSPLLSRADLTIKDVEIVAIDPETDKGTVAIRYDAAVEFHSKMAGRYARRCKPFVVRSPRQSLCSNAT
jgi:hypothetical protein